MQTQLKYTDSNRMYKTLPQLHTLEKSFINKVFLASEHYK